MSRPRLLVGTSVHHPDDARIRAKLIETLAGDWEIHYAAPEPGPADPSDLTWIPLRGRRPRRTAAATSLMLKKGWDLVAIHDPELLGGALIRAVMGRPTLFDLHENLPAQLRVRHKVPRLLRPVLAATSAGLLRLAEASMTITLAEPGYQALFRSPHPVIANYLPDSLPEPQPAADPPFLAYLGDVTVKRGAFLCLETAAGAGFRLVMVGRVSPASLAESLLRRAEELGVELELAGPLPHGEALARIAPARAGLSPLYDMANYRHSLPTKVPEYLALGLPVLAADLAGTRRAVADLQGVTFVQPGDPLRWREAGSRLAGDPDRRALAASQVALVRECFAWPAQEVITVYRRAARS